jgi:hypothetical protein
MQRLSEPGILRGSKEPDKGRTQHAKQ